MPFYIIVTTDPYFTTAALLNLTAALLPKGDEGAPIFFSFKYIPLWPHTWCGVREAPEFSHFIALRQHRAITT